ncbi:MAG: exopolyphosphatase [Deltaproteobacteria bacterium]|nr:exopolyphosphatase [Candidatus Zymogenaceae bacterium]
MRLASVDVGSNTVRLMVGEDETGHGFRVIDRVQRITRLGEGIGSSRRLSPVAIARTADALGGFRRHWENLGATRYRAVATSAVREAENAAEFIAAAISAGVEVEVISGIQEARLVMDGMAPVVCGDRGDLVVIDIGGGSTEFIHARDGDITDIVSTDIGVVRVTELFLTSDPPIREEIDRLLNFLEKRIDQVYNRFMPTAESLRLAGTAGTVTTLAAVDLGLGVYDPNAVEGCLLTRERIDIILNKLLMMTGKQRLVRYPVMTRGREDVIIAGAIAARAIIERFGVGGLIVSDRGILEGIIEGLLKRPYV